MGDVVSDRYELDLLLGRGGMGQVWRARDRRLDRPVAVKVLATNLNDEPEALVRFFSEAQAIARISHPNVVTVLDFGEAEGRPYLVMEYVSGGDLTDIIGEPIYESRALGLVAAVASAAGAAHRSGIVHRDIKSGNILLTEDEKPKLADFGIAASSGGERLTQTGAAIGSPHYVSPEQAKGHSATAQSDVYSLGIVLFELLTGRKPFDGDNVTAIAIAHVEKAPPVPSELVPGISGDIDAIVAKCLDKDQSRRFHDGDALATALHRAMGGAGETVVGVVAGGRKAAAFLRSTRAGSAAAFEDDAEPYDGPPSSSGERVALRDRLHRRGVATAALSAAALAALIVAGVLLANGSPDPASAKTAHGHHDVTNRSHKDKRSRTPSPTTTTGVQAPASTPSSSPTGKSRTKSTGSFGGGGSTNSNTRSGGSDSTGSGSTSTGSGAGGSTTGSSSGGTSTPPPTPSTSPISTPTPAPSASATAAPASGTSTSSDAATSTSTTSALSDS